MSKSNVISIQIGLPKSLGEKGAKDPMDRPWTTGFFKTPIEGKIFLTSTNLVGDGQADLKNHGGVEKAVLAYAAEHYPLWRNDLQLPDLPYGAFGENLTIVEQNESSVCIGDIYDLGEVVLHLNRRYHQYKQNESSVCIGDIYDLGEAQLQVSQPRQPCWKLSRRWRIRDLAMQVQKNGRTGWYFRVLKEGYIEANQTLTLKERPFPQWTIARANQVMHHDKKDKESAAELASCPLLASNWQETLSRRANKSIEPNSSSRLWGNK